MRTLNVCVVSASNLTQAAAVVAKVSLLDLAGRDLKKETHKTRKSTKTDAPQFPPNSFDLGTTYNLSNVDALPTVAFSVQTTSTTGLSNAKVLGFVNVPLDTIDQNTALQDCEFDLSSEGGGSGPAGSIRVKLRWSKGIENSGGEGGAALSNAEIVEDDGMPDERPNELHVSVLRARDLMIMDRSLTGKGSSDPRITLKLGKTTQKTTTIEKNLNPVWNEKYVFVCHSVEESLQVVVEDVDMLANDFMGKLTIAMEPLQVREPASDAAERSALDNKR